MKAMKLPKGVIKKRTLVTFTNTTRHCHTQIGDNKALSHAIRVGVVESYFLYLKHIK